MELAFSRFGFAFLAVLATLLLIAVWRLWLERASLSAKLLVIVLYFVALALAVRLLRQVGGAG